MNHKGLIEVTLRLTELLINMYQKKEISQEALIEHIDSKIDFMLDYLKDSFNSSDTAFGDVDYRCQCINIVGKYITLLENSAV
jgi:hypothetical protein